MLIRTVIYLFTGDVAGPAATPLSGHLHPHRGCRDRGADQTHGAAVGQSADSGRNGEGHCGGPVRGTQCQIIIVNSVLKC